MKREAKPKEALQYYSAEVRSELTQMRSRAIHAIDYHISYQDLWDAMYSPDVQPMMKAMIHKLSGLGASYLNIIDNDGEACRIGTSIIRDSQDTPRPLMVFNHYWEGKKAIELMEYATDISRQKRVVEEQWEDAIEVFDTLNAYCKDAQQMYCMWPPLKQIMEKGNLKYALQSIGEYKPVRNPPQLSSMIYEKMRASIPVVGMAMLMPDDIEPTNSPVTVG